MRSGSNLLEQSLNQFEDIECHGELFNPAFIGFPKSTEFSGVTLKGREAAPLDLLAKLSEFSDTSISGFRIFDGHDNRAVGAVLADTECAKIVLERAPIESFISLEIARTTDQWILRESVDRRGGKIHFDSSAYRKYHDSQAKFYANIRLNLQTSGQTAFWLRYPEQKSIDTLNGIARFLGSDHALKKVKEVLRRQNPGSLRDKVENYDEMMNFLRLMDDSGNEPAVVINSSKRANIPQMVTCKTHPIVFAPIPGARNDEVLRWMSKLDQDDDSVDLPTGYNQRTMFEWMAANPNVLAVSTVSHPVQRAYDAFMSKVFNVGEGSFGVIRRQLIKRFDLKLPDAEIMPNATRETLQKADYAIGQHRAAFHEFLRFLKSNLAEQTSIRIDGSWDTQQSFVAGFNTTIPISIIAKQGQMDNAFRYVESMLDIDHPNLGPIIEPDHLFTLDEIYTRQTENLTRKAYGTDYTRFGFDDYQAALDA